MKSESLQGVRLVLPLTAFMVVLGACSEEPDAGSGGDMTRGSVAGALAQRWYDSGRLEEGAAVFSEHCASCHGSAAQGLTEDWKARLPDGSYPPPPLNGTAHAWHHPLEQLVQTIETGGIPYGGQMPPFADTLNDDQKLAAIAYFQSFWDEEIYQAWLDRGGLD